MVRKTYAMDEDSLQRASDLSRWWGSELRTLSFSGVLREALLRAWRVEKKRVAHREVLADAPEPSKSKRR
jgi:hypothetical protein